MPIRLIAAKPVSPKAAAVADSMRQHSVSLPPQVDAARVHGERNEYGAEFQADGTSFQDRDLSERLDEVPLPGESVCQRPHRSSVESSRRRIPVAIH